MNKCSFCNAEFEGSSCPECGADAMPEMGLASQALRVLTLMLTGRVRQSIHLAVSDEGRRSWILLAPIQLVVPVCLGVMRFKLVAGQEGVAESFIRTGMTWLELYSLLLVLMCAAALLTKSGMTGRSALSLIFTAAVPLAVLSVFGAACSIIARPLAMPFLLLGLCIMLILVYMGFESACIAAKRFGFGWFIGALFIFLVAAELLLPQLL